MNNQSAEHSLKSIILKTINLEDEFVDCFQLFVLPKDDIDFAKAQLEKLDVGDEQTIDALAKLFIAFYFESIPDQIVENIRAYPATNGDKEKCNEYFWAIAGLLHEVKMAINEHSEIFVPYLTAYEEFVGSQNHNSTEDTLLTSFKSNVENAIQAVIKY